ncbi:MAG: dihydrodipicolinate synthase family protein [Belnapia sp.]|nr:dihydrodipicolinate synthase family protein [Belnapia sp.]
MDQPTILRVCKSTMAAMVSQPSPVGIGQVCQPDLVWPAGGRELAFQQVGATGKAWRLSVAGPWDGGEAITLLANLEAGATGSMTGGGYPDGVRQVTDAWFAGPQEDTTAAYERWLPLIKYENHQCGLLAAKALMEEGGVIRCGHARPSLQPLPPATRAWLIAIAKRLDPMVLRWGR